MRLTDHYLGGDGPFEGDLTLVLRSLPVGARVVAASLTLTTVPNPQTGFSEEIATFSGTNLVADQWGVTRSTAAASGTGNANALVEIDFHTRRTLASLKDADASSPISVQLQVDVGGVYMSVRDDGTLLVPGGSGSPLSVPLSATGAPLPALTVSKFKVTATTGTATIAVTEVGFHSVPSNVSVRLGKMAPFWARPGELATSATSPDFSAVLSTFLSSADTADGYYRVPFVVHSDTAGRLEVHVQIDYLFEQPVLSPPLTEVTLRYGYSTLADVAQQVTTVSLPRQAIPAGGRNVAQVRGAFQATRVVQNSITEVPPELAQGAIGDVVPKATVTVSPSSMPAQPLLPTQDVLVSGIDLSMANTQPGLAGLNFAIRSDEAGKPSEDVLVSGVLKVDKPLPGQSAWASGSLPSPLRLVAGTRYWLVVQSLTGDAQWHALAWNAVRPMQASADGGFSWRSASGIQTAATVPPGQPPAAVPPPLAGLFRLRHVPDHFTVPLQLQVGVGPNAVRRHLDEFAPLGRIEFSFDFAETLKTHLGQRVTCGNADVLINGRFDQPPHQDAARRLFGPDVELLVPQAELLTVNLVAGADLSEERFLTMSVQPDGSAPVQIDCSGADPGRTQAAEIAAAIHAGTGMPVELKSDKQDGSLRVHVTTSGYSELTLFPGCRTELPAEWQGTAGEVSRVVLPDEVVVVLASSALLNKLLPCGQGPASAGAATLSQRFPVNPGCVYLLRVQYEYFGPRPEPSWQVAWLDAAGMPAGTMSGLLRSNSSRAIIRSRSAPLAWQTAEASLVPPTAATSAELSIHHVIANQFPLILGRVGVIPTLEPVVGGVFQNWEQDGGGRTLPAGWTAAGGGVTQPANGPPGVTLLGDGADDTALWQTVPAVAGDSYRLSASARASAFVAMPAPPAEQRPRVEVRWIGGSTSLLVVVPLDEFGFRTYAWSGQAPAGTTSAEVRVVQPHVGGAYLTVDQITLERADRVDVPLVFLAEAPGDLTVPDLRVSFDLPQPESAPVVSSVTSRHVGALAKGNALVPPPAVVPAVATEAASPVGTLQAPPAVDAEAEPAPVPTVPEAQPPVTPAPVGLLTDVPGIGPARARRLAGAGIDSLAKLAAARPASIAKLLPILSLKLATDIVAEANRRLASNPVGTVPDRP